MNKIIAIGVLAVAAAAAAIFWMRSNSFEADFKAACMNVLADRLRSPATLEVKEWSALERRPATLEEFVGGAPNRADVGDDEAWERAMKLQRLREELYALGLYDIVLLSFTYDAKNAFGVPIRGGSECSYVLDRKTKRATIDESSIRVDGLTKFDWALEQLKALTR